MLKFKVVNAGSRPLRTGLGNTLARVKRRKAILLQVYDNAQHASDSEPQHREKDNAFRLKRSDKGFIHQTPDEKPTGKYEQELKQRIVLTID